MFQYDVMWGNVGRDIQKTRAEKTLVGTWIQNLDPVLPTPYHLKLGIFVTICVASLLRSFHQPAILINTRIYSVHVLRVSTMARLMSSRSRVPLSSFSIPFSLSPALSCSPSSPLSQARALARLHRRPSTLNPQPSTLNPKP